MAITAELMAIIMNINDQTHITINLKKRKVMDDFNRNLIINGILMDFTRNLMGFLCSSGCLGGLFFIARCRTLIARRRTLQ